MAIELKCGDPDVGPASYTRFVLPFTYCPIRFEGNQGSDGYYEAEKPDDLLWRRKYLTYETADVLFKRAKRFVLRNSMYPLPVKMHFSSCGVDEDITVCMKPPSLALFEWPINGSKCKKRGSKCKKHCDVAGGKQCSRDEHNVLRVGFLVVELYFPEQDGIAPSLDNLLELNELFRYWQHPFAGHEDEDGKYKTLLRNLPVGFSGIKICAMSDSLRLYFERWAGLLEAPVKDDDGNLFELFPREWMEKAKLSISDEEVRFPGWAIYSDNRAFAWTCAITENGGEALRERFEMPDGKAWNFGHWIRLLNADLPGSSTDETHKSRDFEKEWAEERTYKRWEEWGTFYGFSYHCGAMLGPAVKDPPLWEHFRQMYFDQTLLILYIRVTLFRFSMELNRISADALDEDGGKFADWRNEFQRLRWSFALFTNLYQFPLFSNQQQAIEMYSLARKYMDIDDLFVEVKEEIKDCHEYLVIKEETEQSSNTMKLTWIATIALPISIAFGFWGVNIVIVGNPHWSSQGWSSQNWWLMGTIAGALLLSAIILMVIDGKRILSWVKRRFRRRKR